MISIKNPPPAEAGYDMQPIAYEVMDKVSQRKQKQTGFPLTQSEQKTLRMCVYAALDGGSPSVAFRGPWVVDVCKWDAKTLSINVFKRFT